MTFVLPPPHLTAAVYPRSGEDETFAEVCRVVRGHGAGLVGEIEVVAGDQTFGSLSDLVGNTRAVAADRLDSVLAGGSDRCVRAAFQGRHGKLVVEYLTAEAPERHPIGVSMAAGTLGIPPFLRDSSTRRTARTLDKWVKRLFVDMVLATDPWYGAIGVEQTLSSPTAMRKGLASIGPDFYLSHELSGNDQEIGILLPAEFPDAVVTELPSGRAFWVASDSQDELNPRSAESLRRVSVLLGRITARQR